MERLKDSDMQVVEEVAKVFGWKNGRQGRFDFDINLGVAFESAHDGKTRWAISLESEVLEYWKSMGLSTELEVVLTVLPRALLKANRHLGFPDIASENPVNLSDCNHEQSRAQSEEKANGS